MNIHIHSPITDIAQTFAEILDELALRGPAVGAQQCLWAWQGHYIWPTLMDRCDKVDFKSSR